MAISDHYTGKVGQEMYQAGYLWYVGDYISSTTCCGRREGSGIGEMPGVGKAAA